MNLTTNAVSAEANASTAAKNDLKCTQSDSAAVVVESSKKSNGVNIENVIVASSTVNEDVHEPDSVSSPTNNESNQREQSVEEPSPSPMFLTTCPVKNSTREKLLLERVFNLIRADQEQSRMENGNEPSVLMNNEVSDEVGDYDEKQYKCDKCNMQYARHSSLMWHLQSQHTTSTPTARGKRNDHGEFFGYQQSSLDSFACEEGGPFICEYCDKVFPSAKGKRVHISHMHKFEAPNDPAPDDPDDEFNVFPCSICDREFVSSKALKVHVSHMHNRIDTEIPNENGKFPCEICPKEFESSRARKMHTTHVHKPNTHSDSNACVNLSAAIDEGPPYACEQCDKEFDTSKARKIHISHMHKSTLENGRITADESEANEYGLFACDFCKREFETMKAKKIHVSHKHKLEVLSSTSVCSVEDVSLDENVDEQVIFACDICGKEFHSMKAKKIHIYHMHRDEASVKSSSLRNTDSFVGQNDGDLFTCKSCDREFGSLIALRVHITHMHTRVDSEPPNENGAFTCDICGKDFVTTRARSIHTAHTHNIYKRPVGNNYDVLSLDDTVEEDGMFRCEPCAKQFDSIKALKIHRAHKHKEILESKVIPSTAEHGDGLFTCDVCDKDFDSLKAKRIHMTRAHPVDTADDGKMKSSFRRYRSEEVVQNEEQVFPCLVCNRTFSCKKGLSRHAHYHTLTEKKSTENEISSTADETNICTSSSLDCPSEENASLPSNEITSTVGAANEIPNESIPCPHCGKGFETLKAVKIHATRMHAGMPKFTSEDLGPFEFNHEISLDSVDQENVSHDQNAQTVDQQSVHSILGEKTEVNTLECSFCHAMFETVSSMHAHVISEHDNENLFTCTFCRKSFSLFGAFKSHIQGICGTAQNFDGVYLFACDECPKKFSHPKSLQRHWRCDHAHDLSEMTDTEGIEMQEDSATVSSAGVRSRFECPVCTRPFSSVKGMAGHMSAHSNMPKSKNAAKDGEKSSAQLLFKCPFCDRAFSNVKSRAAHMKVHVHQPDYISSKIEEKAELLGETGSIVSNTASHDLQTDDEAHPKISSSTLLRPEWSRIFGGTTASGKSCVCKICSKTFVNIKALAAHSKVHRHTIGSIIMPSDASAVVVDQSNDDRVIMPSETSAEVLNPLNGGKLADVANCTNSEHAEIANTPNLQTTDTARQPNAEKDEVSNELTSSIHSTANSPPAMSSKEYSCLYCPRKFPSLKGITTHSRVHGKGDGVNPMYKVSNVIIPSPHINIAESAKVAGSSMRINSKSNIIEQAVPGHYFKCTHCPKTFMNAKAVAVHTRVHKECDSFMNDSNGAIVGTNKIDGFACSLCSEVFSSAQALCDHMKAHTPREFKCTQCDKSYNSPKALAGHVKFHRNSSGRRIETHSLLATVNKDQSHDTEEEDDGEAGSSFPCQFCDRIFHTHRGYARHLWTHGQGTSSKVSTERSSTEVDVEKPFACRLCGIRFAAGRQLGGHMRHHSHAGHKIPNTFKSIHVDTDDLDVELNEEDQFICDTCDEIFECREDLSEHVRNHADPLLSTNSSSDAECVASPAVNALRDSYLMCHICDRLFSGEKSLSTHMFKKHKKRKGQYSHPSVTDHGALVARKRSTSPVMTIDLENESMEDPIEVGPSSRKRICKSIVPSILGSRLAFGVRTNGEIYAQNQPDMAAQFRERTYECMYCEERFRDQSRLVQHVRTHPESTEHTDQELQDYLNLHTREDFIVQNRQGDEERFIFEQYNTADGYRCSECDETFREKLQMLIHMSYHMNNKQQNSDNDSLLIKADSSLLAPYKCNFCSQRFINKKYRNMHLCKRHRNDIFQCNICHKLFICEGVLKQHYEQHMKQNYLGAFDSRYQCEYCGMCFRSKLILKQHTETECEMNGAVRTHEMTYDDCEIVENHGIKQEPMNEMSLEDQDFEDDDTDMPLCSNNSESVYESFTMDQHTYIEEKVKLENTIDVGAFVCDCCNKRFISESDRHIHENQPQKLLFCCGPCNLYFSDARNAEIHSKMHIVEQENELDIAD